MAEAAEKKSYGYGKRPLWQWIAIYLVVAAVVYGLIYYFFLNKNGGYSYNQNSQSQTTQQQTNTTPSGSIYTSKNDAAKGTYMAAGNGMTLYTFDKDTAGVSNCYDTCATNWPPYLVGSMDTSTLPENVTVITRTDGGMQFAWKGMPLYFYITDKSPRDLTGDGVGSVWHIIAL